MNTKRNEKPAPQWEGQRKSQRNDDSYNILHKEEMHDQREQRAQRDQCDQQEQHMQRNQQNQQQYYRDQRNNRDNQDQRAMQDSRDMRDMQASRDMRDTQASRASREHERRSVSKKKGHSVNHSANQDQKPLKMCFAATRGKVCAKSGQMGAQMCRFAHSTQELQERINKFQLAEKAAQQKKEQAMRVESSNESQIIQQMSRLLEERDRANTILAERLQTFQNSQTQMLLEIQLLKESIIFLGNKISTLPGTNFVCTSVSPPVPNTELVLNSATGSTHQNNQQQAQAQPQQQLDNGFVAISSQQQQHIPVQQHQNVFPTNWTQHLQQNNNTDMQMPPLTHMKTNVFEMNAFNSNEQSQLPLQQQLNNYQ